MSVDDWARREAERQFPMGRLNPGETGNIGNRVYTHDGAAWMARHLADALLSDEAMEAAARNYWALPNWERLTKFDRARQVVFMRAALQAAIDAVTKEARNE